MNKLTQKIASQRQYIARIRGRIETAEKQGKPTRHLQDALKFAQGCLSEMQSADLYPDCPFLVYQDEADTLPNPAKTREVAEIISAYMKASGHTPMIREK